MRKSFYGQRASVKDGLGQGIVVEMMIWHGGRCGWDELSLGLREMFCCVVRVQTDGHFLIT